MPGLGALRPAGPRPDRLDRGNSGIDAAGQALRLIQRGEIDAALVVASDCELVPELLALLCASGSLSTARNDDPGRASRPFDADRDGNVLGEGAAALVLEAEPPARARGARPYARLAGFAARAAGTARPRRRSIWTRSSGRSATR
ncbi:MAG TPA: beta-ketoacyl synthase N-terminal-like domain-containing protein [Gemmatimonadota bacterium]|nr:beta-ketoacyl synthase N-terminal-like domain-containing protein [Gemmatimonadota bacterium]